MSKPQDERSDSWGLWLRALRLPEIAPLILGLGDIV